MNFATKGRPATSHSAFLIILSCSIGSGLTVDVVEVEVVDSVEDVVVDTELVDAEVVESDVGF